MPVIGLAGPNAIGKTTAVSRWVKRYPELWAALADNQRETGSKDWDRVLAGPPNVREWKGDGGDKRNLVESHRVSTRITVIDSARTTALNYFLYGEPVILVTCSWETMERNLKERCGRVGKKYRVDYWTKERLGYEASRRYKGFAAKHPEMSCRVFEVNDYERDWPAVDAYFSKAYRSLHNALARGRKVVACQ